MHRVVITADSTADLPPDLIERYDIHIIPLTVILGDDSYLDGVDIAPEKMYERYHTVGILPKTAAPSVQAFKDFFGPIIVSGAEIVHLDISSELSNAYNAARLAAAEMENVYIVDSRSLCCGIALLAIEGAECRDRGMSACEIAKHLSVLTEKVSASFVLDTLEFIWKGGRCSAVAALGANLLNIKPALEVRDGVLIIGRKYRGNYEHIVKNYCKDVLEEFDTPDLSVAFVTYTTAADEIVKYAVDLVKGRGFKTVYVTRAGGTITSHCGEDCLGILYINDGKEY